MTPDFSPKMLRGFLNAQVEMAGYRAMFPVSTKSQRRPAKAYETAREAEKARIIRRADITADQFDLVMSGRVVGLAARLRLWKALGADPEEFSIRLIGTSGQERII